MNGDGRESTSPVKRGRYPVRDIPSIVSGEIGQNRLSLYKYPSPLRILMTLLSSLSKIRPTSPPWGSRVTSWPDGSSTEETSVVLQPWNRQGRGPCDGGRRSFCLPVRGGAGRILTRFSFEWRPRRLVVLTQCKRKITVTFDLLHQDPLETTLPSKV